MPIVTFDLDFDTAEKMSHTDHEWRQNERQSAEIVHVIFSRLSAVSDEPPSIIKT